MDAAELELAPEDLVAAATPVPVSLPLVGAAAVDLETFVPESDEELAGYREQYD